MPHIFWDEASDTVKLVAVEAVEGNPSDFLVRTEENFLPVQADNYEAERFDAYTTLAKIAARQLRRRGLLIYTDAAGHMHYKAVPDEEALPELYLEKEDIALAALVSHNGAWVRRDELIPASHQK